VAAVITLSARVDVDLLRDYAGVFKDGYTPEDVDRAMGAVRDATGIELAILWDFCDEAGFGGNSDYAISYLGDLYDFEDITEDEADIPSFLAGDGPCPDQLSIRLCGKLEYQTLTNFNYAAVDKASVAACDEPTNGQLTDTDRIALARRVAEVIFENFESYRGDNVGADLAYLLTAIIDLPSKDAAVDWTEDSYGAKPPAILAVLKAEFGPDSPLWGFIKPRQI
jgi:hypothetical protein